MTIIRAYRIIGQLLDRSSYPALFRSLLNCGRMYKEGAWTSGERCPPARSGMPYSYLFSMYGGIIADNYRRAQRAYTIGRPRIQKFPDKKFWSIICWKNLHFKLLLFTHNSQTRIPTFRIDYLFHRRDFSTMNLPTD